MLIIYILFHLNTYNTDFWLWQEDIERLKADAPHILFATPWRLVGRPALHYGSYLSSWHFATFLLIHFIHFNSFHMSVYHILSCNSNLAICHRVEDSGNTILLYKTCFNIPQEGRQRAVWDHAKRRSIRMSCDCLRLNAWQGKNNRLDFCTLFLQGVCAKTRSNFGEELGCAS